MTGISLQGKTTLEVMGALNDSIEIPGRSQVGRLGGLVCGFSAVT